MQLRTLWNSCRSWTLTTRQISSTSPLSHRLTRTASIPAHCHCSRLTAAQVQVSVDSRAPRLSEVDTTALRTTCAGVESLSVPEARDQMLVPAQNVNSAVLTDDMADRYVLLLVLSSQKDKLDLFPTARRCYETCLVHSRIGPAPVHLSGIRGGFT